MVRDHRKLRVFHEADSAALETYRVTAEMPQAERYGLQAQIRRAAVSVAANIVEGTARGTLVEYCRFLRIAHGSARECGYLLGLAGRLGFLDADHCQAMLCQYDSLGAALFSLVRTLEESRSTVSSQSERALAGGRPYPVAD